MTKNESGAALLVTMLALTIVAAIAGALAMTTASESMVAGDFGREFEARYAAEGGLDRALADLAAMSDWNQVLGGSVQSTFTDGAPAGSRTIAGGSAVDPVRVANVANCGNSSGCSATDLTANATGQRPWGANNPVWRPFAYGSVALLMPGAVQSPFYLVVLVADDSAETDGNPFADGAVPCGGDLAPPDCNPGSGAIALRAEAFGPRGAHHVVLAIVERTASLRLRVRARQMTGVT